MYNTSMPVTGKDTKVTEEGTEKDGFSVSFTNGAKEQLEELKDYFKADDFTEVVKLGISFLQRMKELEEKKKKGEGDGSK